MDRPRLRSIQPHATVINGQRQWVLTDPSRFTEESIVLPGIGMAMASMMDGTLTRADLQREINQASGMRFEISAIDSLIEQLDEAFLLESPRLLKALDAMTVRPPFHAGGAYPAERAGLEQFLSEILSIEAAPLTGRRQVGLMAPHIDIQRGARCYSLAYNELKDEPPDVDTYIVLGISHAYCRNPYILTRKDFDTPVGLVETDRSFVDELARGCDFDPFEDEVNHLAEHSVELQAVFLRYLFPGTRIVPVLCGSFYEPLLKGGAPEDYPGIRSFITTLASTLASRKGKAMILSGVDLAHCGMRFGGERLSPNALADLEKADTETLQRAVEGDARGFFSTLQADRGERNYCGTPAIYTMLQVLEASGRLHGYQQCNEPGLASTVSVAAAGYYR